MLDSEHVGKSLEYIKSKCIEPNVYIALQTAKYNYNSQKNGRKTIDNKINITDNGDKNKSPPNSPTQQQPTLPSYETNFNFGKFTLDWIKSNYCNSNEYQSDELDEKMHFHENFYLTSEQDNKIDEQDEDEDDDEDESDIEMDLKYTPKHANQTSTINPNKNKPQHNSSNVFYEAKCAFSRYWIDFSFDANQKILAQDLINIGAVITRILYVNLC